MASGGDAVKVVDASELSGGSSMVQVEGQERGSLLSYILGNRKEQDSEGKKEETPAPVVKEGTQHDGVVHNGENIKTTYDVEEDVAPSYLEQLKRKAHWNGR